jgi:hypothetical protein
MLALAGFGGLAIGVTDELAVDDTIIVKWGGARSVE